MSPGEAVRTYFRTRVPARRFLPLAFLLAFASVGGSAPASGPGFAVAVLLAWTLVVQFRLWDDLADRHQDRARHPERVLSRASALWPFYGTGFVAGVVNLLLIAFRAGAGGRLAVFGLLLGGFAFWYGGLRTPTPSVLRHHVVLIKYPAFVYLVSAPSALQRPRVLILAMGLVYLALCLYEPLHDPEVASAPGARVTMAAAALAFVAVAALMLRTLL